MKADLFSPTQLDHDTLPPLSDYGWRLLAEGDSWFSITTFGRYSSNLLAELRLPRSSAIINCAAPGATLQRMVDRRADPQCAQLLRGKKARYWDAILLSAGGNDLIAAAATPLDAGPDGSLTPAEQRLVCVPAEAGAGASAEDWISEPGWTRLAAHLREEFARFVAWRDEGPSGSRPLLLHTYATPVVRRAGEAGSTRGWLYPALLACGVPKAWRQPVADLLFERLRVLLLLLDADRGGPDALPRVHVFDSAAVPLVPANPESRGRSGDWINEIHLTAGGYRKLGLAFGAWIGKIMVRYP